MPARWLVVALVLLARAWPAAAADGVIRLHLPAGTGGSPAFLVRLDPTQGAPEERTAGGDRQVVVFRGVRPGAYRLHIESSLDPASTDLLIQAWETIIFVCRMRRPAWIKQKADTFQGIGFVGGQS